jgi:hypothetical protein
LPHAASLAATNERAIFRACNADAHVTSTTILSVIATFTLEMLSPVIT